MVFKPKNMVKSCLTIVNFKVYSSHVESKKRENVFFFFNITIYFELHVIISKLKSTLRQKKKNSLNQC